ncbi:Coupling protein TraD [Crateriforma conspicua]|uniref:Coupling protein TraD n=2 Tax=Crateriforma conspicua TaxID=2527996 RepID=A0A5C6FLM0_9PLAN|nr:Coupling protein TraD [Crateriforma conspicua]
MCIGAAVFRRWLRRRRYARGRILNRQRQRVRKTTGGLRWGNNWIDSASANQHFLAVGTTGSGKSLVQRLLMKDALQNIKSSGDTRALIFDAKNDIVGFLQHCGVDCPVYSLNPFESRDEFPAAVRWDIAGDITSPARAMNLAACLIPAENGGSNQYFTDAARQVISGVVESLIRHSPGVWTFSDFVFGSLSMERLRQILDRDAAGRDVLENFFGDERTAYQVFTTVASRMNYFRPVAALWQRCERAISIRHWLQSDSILLLGMNASSQMALNAINETVFRVVVEEIDSQADSRSRRTWIWIDEARLSGPILRGPLLPYLAVKGRSRGACLVLAFQDIEGFREAAGVRIANEIIAQCSHKALLRLESEESAAWASRTIGQYEVLDTMISSPTALSRGGTRSEQVARRDAVMASEFFGLPPTSSRHGLTGCFLTPHNGVVRATISGQILREVFVPDELESRLAFVERSEFDQWLRSWSDDDLYRLKLRNTLEQSEDREQRTRLRLRNPSSIRVP